MVDQIIFLYGEIPLEIEREPVSPLIGHKIGDIPPKSRECLT
jgi:hypothetical protein